MKQLNFKKIFLNLLWPLLPFTAQAQENNTLYSILSKDNILVSSPSVQNQEEDIVTQMPNRHHKYDKRVHRYRRAWEALIPTHTKLQYAGGMGLLSWGIGWDYGKRGQWETDLLETELYPVEYLAGQRLLAGTADYRNLFQHRIQR